MSSRASRRGPWLPEEDCALVELVRTQGPNNWVRISQQLQHRSPKQCRERYHQNLKPSLNHEPISSQEGEMIERLVDDMGKRWAEIARRLGNRSDNAVKNWWNGSVNRRKRTTSQNVTTKQIGNRLHPIPSTKLERSHYRLPPGVITAVHDLPPTITQQNNRWSAPESSSMRQRTLQPPTARSQSSSESNPQHPRAAQGEFGFTYSQQTRGFQTSYRDTFNRDEPTSRLPSLRLPPLTGYQADPIHPYERPSLSPSISEFSYGASVRPPPSLMSDDQSNSSISPKTVVSPRLSATWSSDPMSHAWSHHDRPPTYGYHGLSGQMALSPLDAKTTQHTFKNETVHKQSSPQIEYVRDYGCNTFNNSFPERHQTLRDSRMHVSSLVQ